MSFELLFYCVGAVAVLFGFAVFFGAPYVPTLKGQIHYIFSLYHFTDNDVFVDIGSGDGALLRAAAKKGIRSIGYEINPVLWAISTLLNRPYRQASVRLGNFWTEELPSETTVIYVFLNQRYMKKLKQKLEYHVRRTKKPLHLISFGFYLPGMKALKHEGAMYLYRFDIQS